jgi:signal transduction histidine kinase
VLLAVLAQWVLPISFPLTPVFLIVGGIVLYNLFFWLWSRRLRSQDMHLAIPRVRTLVRTQTAIDLVTLVVLLHFTGGVENPFVFYLVFHIVIASVLLSRRVAYLFATLAVVLFGALAGLEYLGWVPHVHLEGFVSPQFHRQAPTAWAVVLSLATVLYISAYMASSIAGELRERQREVAALRDRCLIDNSALEEANKRLVEVDRLRTHFLAIASHDLRAPLAAVQSYLRIALGGFVGDLNDQQRDILEKSSLRIDELLKLINDLLDNARIEAGQIVSEMEEVSIAQVVADAIENVHGLAQEKGLVLRAEVPEDLPMIDGAPSRLVQVVTNLLSNAVQFTASGGSIAVRVSVANDHLQTEVMDTGTGISPEAMPRIFEEFYRGEGVKTKGTGLGLAIAKKIVEAHGGEIWAESPYSESPKGSRFVFTLPT